MKSAMHMALKNHMAKAKMAAPEGSPKEEATESSKKEKDEDRGDAAPSVEDHGHAAHLAAMPGAAGELGPEHIPLLQQLIAQLSHPGRDAMTMDERAGGAMKEKMASIMKHRA